jgi:hypothetical protein
MDRKVVLEAVSVLRDRLDSAIQFSRLESPHCDSAWREYHGGAERDWETQCEQHREWYEQYDAALRTLEEQSYPVPGSWWLSEFEPQICYVACAEANKAWILGTWPLIDDETRTPDNVTPQGVIVPAGTIIEATWNEALSIDGIMDEKVVRKWEAVYGDIAETHRRLVELWDVDQQLTPHEARAQFCFDEWQSGKSLKEINAGLKRHPEWEHFDDERKVRGPINSWANRLGVTPRKGQPGRRAKA